MKWQIPSDEATRLLAELSKTSRGIVFRRGGMIRCLFLERQRTFARVEMRLAPGRMERSLGEWTTPGVRSQARSTRG